MKYVMMFVDTEQFTSDLQAMTPQQRAKLYQRVDEWFAEHATAIKGGSKLQPAHTATTVRLDRGEPVVMDGPFVEGKEVVSGFLEVDVADLDEALRLVRTWPGCPVVEIRPIAAAAGPTAAGLTATGAVADPAADPAAGPTGGR